jgi:PHD/YefM family antitoxin component YafN of YafNO toxin-antitoxin module
MESEKEKYITDKNGTKTAVIIPIKKYERLMEDIHDLTIVAERKNESTISLNELKKRLNTDAGL